MKSAKWRDRFTVDTLIAHGDLDFVADASFAAFPLAGREELLVETHSTDEHGKNKIVCFDPVSGKGTEMAQLEGRFALLPTGDGKRAFVLRQEDPQRTVWTSIEEWDLVAARKLRAELVRPPLASRSVRLLGNVHMLAIHEYMVQPVILWDLKAGRLAALVAPQGGGIQAFDITPDGTKLVGFVGPWMKGTLTVTSLAVYDIAAAESEKK